MKIENYKALKNVDIKNIGKFAVFLGENGVGKSTLFDVFCFMKRQFKSEVRKNRRRKTPQPVSGSLKISGDD